jgi:hypothetical protein
MAWLIAAMIGFIIGTLISALISALSNNSTQSLEMPHSLTVALGVGGALTGGSIAHATGFGSVGNWGFYLTTVALSFGFVAGGFLAHILTRRDRRL